MTEASEIRHRTLRGIGWTASFRLLQQVFQIGFSAALARLLVPADFGLFAMMGVFTGFAGLFVDLGFSAAIVQRPSLEERHRSSAFWMNLGFGTALTLVMAACAPGLAAFYGRPLLTWIGIGFAPVFLLAGLSGVQTALRERDLDFRGLTMIENASFLASNVAGIVGALSGLGVWSLVLMSLVGAGARSLLLWISSNWRPRMKPDRTTIQELWRFSGRLTAFNVVVYSARNVDNLLVGRFFGATQLGYYSRAYSLMLLPQDVVSSVTTRVLYPAFSRLQGDHERTQRVFVRAVGLIALVVFPAIVGLLVLAKPFVLTLYGGNWGPAVPLLQVLCVASLLQTLGRTTSWIFQSQGETGKLLQLGGLISGAAIVSFFVGLPWGVKGITISYTVWTILATYPMLAFTGRLIGMRAGTVLRALSGVTACSVLMGLGVWAFEAKIGSASEGTKLAAGVPLGMALYFGALLALAPLPFREFRQLAREGLESRRTSRRDSRLTSA